MKYIRENIGYLGNRYEVFIDDIKIRDIFINRVKKEYKNYSYIVLIDSSGKVIEETFKYLNSYCRDSTLNSREQAATALKMLYSFLEIKEKSIKNIDKADVKNLSDFILGLSSEGVSECYEFKVHRSITTHNLYFDAIRKYLKALSISNEALFEQRVVSAENGGFGMLGYTRTTHVKKYVTNKSRHASFTQYVPKYISIDEYKKIINYIDDTNSEYGLRNKLIINLMYTRGLRLGEVLGITLQDIKVHPDNRNAGAILIRNRLSDKRYQFGKSCLKVRSKTFYESKIYNTEGSGYQKVIIPPQLMDQIKEYIDSSRDVINLSDKKLNSIYTLSKADNVEKGNEENYYLFLNKNGRPLSSTGWSKILKEIFKANNIKIDKESKRDNLSHRFRHGFAMYLIENEKKELAYVQHEMRHRSIKSTMRYYNPKPETILKDTEIIQDRIEKTLLGKCGENNSKDI